MNTRDKPTVRFITMSWSSLITDYCNDSERIFAPVNRYKCQSRSSRNITLLSENVTAQLEHNHNVTVSS